MDDKSSSMNKELSEIITQIDIEEVDSILKLILSRLTTNRTLYNLLQNQQSLTHKEALALYSLETKKEFNLKIASEKEKRDFLYWIFEHNCRILRVSPKDILTFYRNLASQQAPEGHDELA